MFKVELGNASFQGKYIVMDSFLGLLTAGVLQHCSQGQVIQVLDHMGYQSSTRQAVQAVGLGELRGQGTPIAYRVVYSTFLPAGHFLWALR